MHPDIQRWSCSIRSDIVVIGLTEDDLDRLMKIGPLQFSYYLFPDEENAPAHFLSERHRSEKF